MQPNLQADRSELILVTHVESVFADGIRLRRMADRGLLHRVWRGHYILSTAWSEKSAPERHATTALAAALARDGSQVVSHLSAAAMWGLPLLVPWSDVVHLTAPRSAGGRSSRGVQVHSADLDERDVIEHHGIAVTSLARTVVDNAAHLEHRSAIAMVDRALHRPDRGHGAPLTSKGELFEVLDRALPLRGSVRASGAIGFGSALAGSPAESASRVNIALGGFDEPELQRRWSTDAGDFDSDFYWDGFDGIGECDGKEKYFSPTMLRGRSPSDVLWAEKAREDALRRKVSHFIRWDFATAMSLPRLSARLAGAGLRAGRARPIR